MSTLKQKALAPGKVNLSLRIKGRLKTGYHLLQTLICPISLSDELEVSVSENKVPSGRSSVGLQLSYGDELSAHVSALKNVSVDAEKIADSLKTEDNLVVKAARLFQDYFQFDRDIHISLKKNLPFSAGLGGGSSDCATVLLLLANLSGRNLDFSEICSLGGQLGADVPPLMTRRLVYAWGTGTDICPVRSSDGEFEQKLRSLFCLLIKPLMGIPTIEAYKSLGFAPTLHDSEKDALRPRSPDGAGFLNQFRVAEIDEFAPPKLGGQHSLGRGDNQLTLLPQTGICERPVPGTDMSVLGCFRNDFQQIVLDSSKELSQIRTALETRAVPHYLLAGSGSSVVAFVQSEAACRKLETELRELDRRWFIRPVMLCPEGCM